MKYSEAQKNNLFSFIDFMRRHYVSSSGQFNKILTLPEVDEILTGPQAAAGNFLGSANTVMLFPVNLGGTRIRLRRISCVLGIVGGGTEDVELGLYHETSFGSQELLPSGDGVAVGAAARVAYRSFRFTAAGSENFSQHHLTLNEDIELTPARRAWVGMLIRTINSVQAVHTMPAIAGFATLTPGAIHNCYNGGVIGATDALPQSVVIRSSTTLSGVVRPPVFALRSARGVQQFGVGLVEV